MNGNKEFLRNKSRRRTMGWKAICLMIKKGNIFAFQATSAPIFR